MIFLLDTNAISALMAADAKMDARLPSLRPADLLKPSSASRVSAYMSHRTDWRAIAGPRLKPLLLALALIALTAAGAPADTYGLPPAMEFRNVWSYAETALPAAGPVVARDKQAVAEFWQKHAPGDDTTHAPDVDFNVNMLVGYAAGRGEKVFVYRVELDDAADPRVLLVHVALAGESALLGGDNDERKHRPVGARVYMVETPASALPVRFVQDSAVDGPLWGSEPGGVHSTVLAEVAAPAKPEAPPVQMKEWKFRLREQAEKRVRDALTPEEIESARRTIHPHSVGGRYPEACSVIQIGRGTGKNWAIRYDKLHFEVDMETGYVVRTHIIDRSRDGTYRLGRWEYRFVTTNPAGHLVWRSGRLFYAGKELPEPRALDRILTPWGMMQWYGPPGIDPHQGQQSGWLTVAGPIMDKKGTLLPDPGAGVQEPATRPAEVP